MDKFIIDTVVDDITKVLVTLLWKEYNLKFTWDGEDFRFKNFIIFNNSSGTLTAQLGISKLPGERIVFRNYDWSKLSWKDIKKVCDEIARNFIVFNSSSETPHVTSGSASLHDVLVDKVILSSGVELDLTNILVVSTINRVTYSINRQEYEFSIAYNDGQIVFYRETISGREEEESYVANWLKVYKAWKFRVKDYNKQV